MPRPETAPPYVAGAPLPLRIHALSEPIIALVLVAAPFALGFSGITAALVVSVAAGVVVLLQAATTRWPWAPLPVIPLGLHAATDMVLGIALLSLPFLLGYADDATGAWLVHVVVGVGLFGAAWGTDWNVR